MKRSLFLSALPFWSMLYVAVRGLLFCQLFGVGAFSELLSTRSCTLPVWQNLDENANRVLTLLLTVIWLYDVLSALIDMELGGMYVNTILLMTFFAFYFKKYISNKSW